MSSVFGVRIGKTTRKEVVKKIQNALVKDEHLMVFTPNPEMLLLANKDEKFVQTLNTADICVPDGIGIFIAYQAQESKLPQWIKIMLLPWWGLRALVAKKTLSEKFGERICGSDLTKDILDISNRLELTTIILDAPVKIVKTQGDKKKKKHQEIVQSILQKKYPHARFYQVLYENDTLDQSAQKINKLGPTIVVGVSGMRRQERVLQELSTMCPQLTVCIGAGGSIDLLTGFARPTPAWTRKIGLEWLYRLFLRPKRHARRIINVLTFLIAATK